MTIDGMTAAGRGPESAGGGARGLRRRAFLAGTAAVGAVGAVAAGAAMASADPDGGAAASGPAAAAGGNVVAAGRGMADMTGEPFGAGFNGYAVPEQQASGIHQRQYARAFVFVDDSGNRLVHCTADLGLMFQSIQQEVLRRLAAVHGGLYHEGNVLIGASHTHVAPGGTSGHFMVDLTTSGFRPTTFEANVKGIVDAILRAHDDIQPSTIALTRGHVADAGRNRSHLAFERNPEEDRARFPGMVNPESTTLHVIRGGSSVGFINWYAIHPTTFGPEHTLISGDSKGYAAWKTEHEAGVDHRNVAAAPFVAAFAMSAPGDISPNHGLVPGSGPGADMYDSARILGERQRSGVAGGVPVPLPGGGIEGRHQWVDFSAVQVDGRWTPDGAAGTTGPAILGAAFAASSQEDGGGDPALGFNEGERGGTPWLHRVNQVVVPPSAKAIHGNKDLAIPAGYIPGMIQQTFLFQVHRLGGFHLVSLSFEPTIVTADRIRRAVAGELGVDPALVQVQGYVNGYGHYLTTPEEYDQQDYEGGATAFGRLATPAATQILAGLAGALTSGTPVDAGSAAGDLTGRIPPSPVGNPFVDAPPAGYAYGDVMQGPDAPVSKGEMVSVTFAAANPNSDLRHDAGFLTVTAPDGTVVADDSHEDTRLEFVKDGLTTTATVTWDTRNAAPGTYTVTYAGSSRELGGRLSPFEGSAPVTVA
ncbi:neutral/alkaline non-lysosomal ceramidase N-terminal domain-containing protein [Corynebacterium sp.]|uniref:neutral/alkaline non-lysosomal ceramidase N-terminal domain-containing protein n=1 Tax=Corynebacterium sp. TaxID=1720 RepID=UPI0026DB2496|nr:neutral/alkaline non-lysosomal ceramidase N-terminal domain-containing protein [Corynebacterium sp.]MDO4610782.1 neutral/alkaline non-lysosomal ceramidase N-terminal domain-containing protein [Corynebacterium sp.]